jgi:preprotein translocase subunit SecD
VLTPTKPPGSTRQSGHGDGFGDRSVRKRIDELGTREPTIIRQGAQRIVVQVPGLRRSGCAEGTARPDRQAGIQAGRSHRAQRRGAGHRASGQRDRGYADPEKDGGVAAIAVKRYGGIKGDQLTDAQQSFDQQTNEPVVSITFDQQGGAKFAKLTTENVNGPSRSSSMARCCPRPTSTSRSWAAGADFGQLHRREANQLAFRCVSGALPVDLKVVEERTVGPDLGADSIRKGMIAMVVGTLALMAFIFADLWPLRLYANVALVINVLMILGVMAMPTATLTLPGIAGFVLTIGAAVDANVLINERIREERARGGASIRRSRWATRKPAARFSTPTSPTSSLRC